MAFWNLLQWFTLSVNFCKLKFVSNNKVLNNTFLCVFKAIWKSFCKFDLSADKLENDFIQCTKQKTKYVSKIFDFKPEFGSLIVQISRQKYKQMASVINLGEFFQVKWFE